MLGGAVLLLATRDSYDEAANAFGWGHITVGFLAYAAVPPILHLAHRNASGAALSVVTRGGFPLGAAFLGAAVAATVVEQCPSGLTVDGDSVCSSERLNQVATGALIGAAIGAVFASVFDATVLTHRYVLPGPPTWTVLPTMHAGAYGVTIAATL
jgi:hypothetical protein